MKDYYTVKDLEDLSRYLRDVKIFKHYGLPRNYESRMGFFNPSVWRNDTEEFKETYKEKLKECEEYYNTNIDRKENFELLWEILNPHIVENESGVLGTRYEYAIVSDVYAVDWKLPGFWETAENPFIFFRNYGSFCDYVCMIKETGGFTLDERDVDYYKYDCSYAQTTIDAWFNKLDKEFLNFLLEKMEDLVLHKFSKECYN